MTTATVELLQEAYEDNPRSALIIEQMAGMQKGKFDETKAKTWINTHKRNHLDHNLGKGTRPWEIVNVSAKLDSKQPWFGVEYETGYGTKTAYHRIVNYLWQHHPLTAIDREGCGAYPCEITFAPVNMDVFMSKEYHMDRLLAYQKRYDAEHAAHRPGDHVGTHVNVSTPTYRKLPRLQTYKIGELLNNINHMDDADYRKVYGRRPYGGFNNNHDGRGNQWVEGKLFNSTGSSLTWAKYKRVMARLGELIEHLSRLETKGKLPAIFQTPAGKAVNRGDTLYSDQVPDIQKIQCPNLPEFLLGKIDVKDLEFSYVNIKKDNRFLNKAFID
jgi:hypothetical protein